MEESTQLEAEHEGWQEAKWFKLHLHPLTMAPPPYTSSDTDRPIQPSPSTSSSLVDHDKFEVPPLPSNVNVQRCYSDMMRYLFEGAEAWYKQNAPDGATIWSKLRPRALKVVLAHPNGWSLPEQDVLRRAVADADILTVEQCQRDLVFVTEYCRFALLSIRVGPNQMMTGPKRLSISDSHTRQHSRANGSMYDRRPAHCHHLP